MSTPPDNPFTPRLGRIRSAGSGGRAKTYLTRMTKALSSAGGVRRTTLPARPRPAPRGGQRRAIVKARIVRMSASSAAALAAHIGYIRRDAALEEKDRGKLFDAMSEDAGVSDLTKSIADEDYSRVHSQLHGEEVNIAVLVPHMLEAFLASDAGFRKARKALTAVRKG